MCWGGCSIILISAGNFLAATMPGLNMHANYVPVLTVSSLKIGMENANTLFMQIVTNYKKQEEVCANKAPRSGAERRVVIIIMLLL